MNDFIGGIEGGDVNCIWGKLGGGAIDDIVDEIGNSLKSTSENQSKLKVKS